MYAYRKIYLPYNFSNALLKKTQILKNGKNVLRRNSPLKFEL